MRFLEDARYSVRCFYRSLRTESGPTVVTLITLAVAIAANTAIFGVGNALLFKKIPGIADPGRLVHLHQPARWRVHGHGDTADRLRPRHKSRRHQRR